LIAKKQKISKLLEQ